MNKSMNEVMVRTIVKKAIRNLKTDPERTICNLVDMAFQFADSRFQQEFYSCAQRILSNAYSGYYVLAKDSSPGKDARLVRRIRREYPTAAEALAARAEKYNEGVALAHQFAAEGKLLILAPDDTCGVHTLCRDARAMKQLYAKGFADVEKIAPFLFGGCFPQSVMFRCTKSKPLFLMHDHTSHLPSAPYS